MKKFGCNMNSENIFIQNYNVSFQMFWIKHFSSDINMLIIHSINAFENVVCEMASILSRSQYVKTVAPDCASELPTPWPADCQTKAAMSPHTAELEHDKRVVLSRCNDCGCGVVQYRCIAEWTLSVMVMILRADERTIGHLIYSEILREIPYVFITGEQII